LLTGIVALVLAVRRARRLRLGRSAAPKPAARPVRSRAVVARPPPPPRPARPLPVAADGRSPRTGLPPVASSIDPERIGRAGDSDRAPAEMDLEALEPVSAEPDSQGEPEGLAKICPACGSRYGAQHRVCTRDESELATIN
jgi:hypothetical protein